MSLNTIPHAPSSTTSNAKVAAMDSTSPEESTQDSAISGLSILDDEDDDFYKRTISHIRTNSSRIRDRQRLQHTMEETGIQAFRKSRPQQRLALTIENLEKNNSTPEDEGFLNATNLSRGRGTDELNESERSDSPNIPKQWGRKGRQRNDFLRRIDAHVTTEAIVQPVEDPDALFTRRRSVYTGDPAEEGLGWVKSPARESEKEREELEGFQKDDSVTLNRPYRRHIDKIMELENNEPMGDSPVSLRSNRRRLSDIARRREIDEVQKRAITTGRLAEVGARDPSLRRPRSTSQELRQGVDTDDHKQVSQDAKNVDGRSRSTAANTNQSKARTISRRDLLRQLSRTPSATPSPDPHHADYDPLDHRKIHEQTHDPSQIDHRLPTPPSEDVTQELPAAQTPLVTGAFLETPVVQRQLQKHTDVTSNPAPILKVKPELHEPDLPKSAAQALIAQRRNRPEGDNDTTQLSLTSLLAHDEPTLDITFDNDTQELISNVSSPVVQKRESSSSSSNKQSRQEEARTLEKLSRTLKNTYRGFRDLSRGMKRMEKQVELADANSLSQSKLEKPPTATSSHTLLAHHSNSHYATSTCSACGTSLHHPIPTLFDVLRATVTSIFSLLYTTSPRTNNLRLTWLGIIILAVVIFYFIEVGMCVRYCQPLYATSMSGFGVDYTAPEMPYVTITVLARPFEPIWGPVVRIIAGTIRWWYKTAMWALLGYEVKEPLGRGAEWDSLRKMGGWRWADGPPGGNGGWGVLGGSIPGMGWRADGLFNEAGWDHVKRVLPVGGDEPVG